MNKNEVILKKIVNMYHNGEDYKFYLGEFCWNGKEQFNKNFGGKENVTSIS